MYSADSSSESNREGMILSRCVAVGGAKKVRRLLVKGKEGIGRQVDSRCSLSICRGEGVRSTFVLVQQWCSRCSTY